MHKKNFRNYSARGTCRLTNVQCTMPTACLSHDSDFGGGRLSCDFEEENEHFSEYSTVSKTTKSKTVIRIFMKPRRQKGFLSSQAKSFSSLSSLCPPSASLVYGINGKCRLYVALQSHGRSLWRCSSVRTHPQRSPLGRCLGVPKWQMDFCKLPNQITRLILDERSNLTFTRSGATASSLDSEVFRVNLTGCLL